MHNLSTFGVKIHHGQIRTHKIHHNPELGETTTFPLIVYSIPGHGNGIQMTFCPRTPNWESWNSQNWDSCNFGGAITLCEDL